MSRAKAEKPDKDSSWPNDDSHVAQHQIDYIPIKALQQKVRPKIHDEYKKQPKVDFKHTTMQSQVKDVMALCNKLLEQTDNKQITAARKHSKTGATIAGALSFAGGLLLGPPGIFVGATVGGAVGWWVSRGKFKPLHQIIKEMSPQQEQELYNDVKAALGNLIWHDLSQLTEIVMNNASMQTTVLNTLTSYATNKLGAKVCGHCGK